MILRTVPKPPLESCRGYWIEMDEDQAGNSFSEGREGLIEGVDYKTKVMIVDFGSKEIPEEYEVDYDSVHIKQWFKMTSRREQNLIVSAAIKLQVWAKRKLNLKSSQFTQTLSAMNSTQSMINLSASLSTRSLLPAERSSSQLIENASRSQIEITESGNQLMSLILRPIPRPSLERCAGYWIALSSSPDREALVREVDMQKRILRAEYVDTAETADTDQSDLLVSYDDTSLAWYRSSTRQEERKEMTAAIRIQTLVRGRSVLVLFLFLNDSSQIGEIKIEESDCQIRE
jgi:hypothetical protein